MAHKVRPAADNVEGMVREFELKLERLKVLYEQYFMGIEKREPRVPHHEVVRLMRELDAVRINNTRLRYRYRSLVQRFNTYRTYWNRTIRAIDNGTYHRDLARVRRNWARKGINVEVPTTGRVKSVAEVERAVGKALGDAEKQPEKKKRELPNKRNSATDVRGKPADQIPLDQHAAQESRLEPIDLPQEPGAPRPPARAAPAPPRPPTPSQPTPAVPLPQGFTADEMLSLYRRYVKAKRMVGEDPTSVQYASLARSVAHQVPKLREMNSGRDVDFDVVVRQGKVVLKAKNR
jgi:hypothetical protein